MTFEVTAAVRDAENLTRKELAYPEHKASTSPQTLVVLSAPCRTLLEEGIQEHSTYIKSNIDRIADISYTLCNRREKLPARSFAVVSGLEDFKFSPPLAHQGVPKIVMMFTGQGTQWVGMAKE